MIAKKYLQSQNQIIDTLDSTVIASLPISVSSTPSPFQCLKIPNVLGVANKEKMTISTLWKAGQIWKRYKNSQANLFLF